jgi:DNA-binding CsgD family transcriptional regulator
MAHSRASILSPLAAQPACSRADAKAAGAALGLSERQVYNWVRKLRLANGSVGALSRGGSRTTKGLTRLPPEMETQLDRIITQEMRDWPEDQDAGLFVTIVKRCQAEMSPAPSASTIFRRLCKRSGRAGKRRRDDRSSADAPGLLRGVPPPVSTESLLLPLYDTVGNPAGWRGFLNALSHSYGGAMSAIAMHDYAGGTGFADASTGLGREYGASYARYYSRLNPWLGAAELREVGLAAPSDSILPYGDLLRTVFYNDWCRPQGIGGGLGVTVERSGRRVMAVTVLLSRPAVEQDPSAAGRLQALTPHLLWVSQLHRQFTALEARAAAAEGALDRLATALLLLNEAGQVLYMNDLAERFAALADGVTVRAGRLEAAASSDGEALQQLIRTSLQSTPELGRQPGGVMRISRPSGRTGFEVLVAPIAGDRLKRRVSGALVAVFMRDPSAQMATPVDWVRTMFGLTRAEARLMQALLAGESFEALQGLWQLGRETLRTQLKSVFTKTGVSRQSDLIRVGLRSLTASYGMPSD